MKGNCLVWSLMLLIEVNLCSYAMCIGGNIFSIPEKILSSFWMDGYEWRPVFKGVKYLYKINLTLYICVKNKFQHDLIKSVARAFCSQECPKKWKADRR